MEGSMDLRVNIVFKWVRGQTMDDILLETEKQMGIRPAKRSKVYTQISGAPAFEMGSRNLRIITDRKNVMMLDPLNRFGERQAEDMIAAIMKQVTSADHISAHIKAPQFKSIIALDKGERVRSTAAYTERSGVLMKGTVVEVDYYAVNVLVDCDGGNREVFIRENLEAIPHEDKHDDLIIIPGEE